MNVNDLLISFDGSPDLLILHIEAEVVWVGDISFAMPPIPEKKRAYATQPKKLDRAEVEKGLSDGTYALRKFEAPEHLRIDLGNAQQGGHAAPRPLRTRRDYSKWIRHRDKAYALIKPLVEGRHISDLLESGEFRTWPAQRAKELGISPARVYEALNKYLIGGGVCALTPAYQYTAAPGKHRKYTKGRRPGRRNTSEREPLVPGTTHPSDPGYVITETCRERLRLGYKRHANRTTTLRAAYNATIEDYWCESKVYGPDGKAEVKLHRSIPSFDQFRYWGPHPGEPSFSEAKRGKVGLNASDKLRGPRSTFRIKRVGLKGEMDSSSTNQNLVSEASALKVLPAPWITTLQDTAFNYRLGMYCGFEKPSALTTKLTLLNALEDKVQFCARYGVHIEPDDWLSQLCRDITVDNGEAKSEETMDSIQEMEGSLTYAPLNFAQGKAFVESDHRSRQVALDNVTPGSTQGRRRQRGEPDPKQSACMTFFEYMPQLIKTILHHNNEQLIPIPFMEMRKDGIKPTRKAMMLWSKNKGYVASTPTSVDSLRVRCLPKIQARLTHKGIELFDPSVGHDAVIRGLVYWSKDLVEGGYLTGRSKRWEVHMDPSTASYVWLSGPKLLKIPLQTNDPRLHRLTLLDFIAITQDDKLRNYFYRHLAVEKAVQTRVERDHVTAQGKKRRAAAIADQAKRPSKKSLTRVHKDHLTEEQVVAIAEATGSPILHRTGDGRPVVFNPLWGLNGSVGGAMDRVLEQIRGRK